jgi:hypothetical protein
MDAGSLKSNYDGGYRLESRVTDTKFEAVESFYADAGLKRALFLRPTEKLASGFNCCRSRLRQ